MTIYPVIENRDSCDANKIYQFLKVVDESLDNREPGLDLMCFPDLFCYGRNGQNEKNRKNPIQFGEFAKLVMKSADRRFACNTQYLFHMLNQANMRQLSAGIFHKLNVTSVPGNLTAQQFMGMIKKNELEGNLSTIFAILRNTQQYWKKPLNDISCMVSNYGPATFFVTISPTEYDWEELLALYRTTIKHTSEH